MIIFQIHTNSLFITFLFNTQNIISTVKLKPLRMYQCYLLKMNYIPNYLQRRMINKYNNLQVIINIVICNRYEVSSIYEILKLIFLRL